MKSSKAVLVTHSTH